MRIQLIAVFLFSTLFMTMCGGGDEPVNENSDNSKTTTAASESPSESPEAVEPQGGITPPPTPTPVSTVEAVTLKPLVSAYCKALKEKNEEALRKVYTAASIRRLDADRREEGEKSIVDYLNNAEPVGDECKVINETIDGNVAEANVITESYPGPNGVSWKFVKENGSWKMTTESSDFDAVKKQTGK